VRALAALLVLAFCGSPAAAQTLAADLSSHLIAITTGFTGTEVTLFGATDGGADVIAVVRGPEAEIAVRRKSRVAGIWMNTRRITFTAVPSFYAVYSNRPLAEIATPGLQALHQIGLENMHFVALEEGRSAAEVAEFREALLAEQQRTGRYGKEAGRIAFLGDRLFRATIAFPASVPVGTYLVEVFLVRNKGVVSGQTTPLVVSQIGVDAEVYEFAQRRALVYGILAVVVAAVAGWLASLPFRDA
jgi:uncharacterized protein (TIGR02186 family)